MQVLFSSMRHFCHLLVLCTIFLMSQGCFESDGTFVGPKLNLQYDFLMDYDSVHPSRHDGVIPVEYKMKGVYGPDRLHIINDANVGTILDLEVVNFPDYSKDSEHYDSYQKLKLKAEQHVKNYVSAQKRVIVYTLKRVIEHELKYFALDIRNPDRDETLSDYLVTRGLIQVDHDVAKLSKMDYLIDLEKEARHQDLGIWKLDLE